MTGIKHDTGKPRMSLIPDGVLDEVLAVLEFGAQKYSHDNWHKLENAKTRYYDAAHRHIAADRRGEKTDEESGRHPLAHAIADLIFMLGLDLRGEGGAGFNVGDFVTFASGSHKGKVVEVQCRHNGGVWWYGVDLPNGMYFRFLPHELRPA